jgi:hypothetical protein
VFVIVALRLARTTRRDNRIEALEALSAAFSDGQDISSPDQVPAAAMEAFSRLLDFAESQQATALVIAKHKATRRERTGQYLTLLINGGNRTIGGYQFAAALPFVMPWALDYLLSSPAIAPARKLTDIERALDGGILVYEAGPAETSCEADRLAAAEFAESGASRPYATGSACWRLLAAPPWHK